MATNVARAELTPQPVFASSYPVGAPDIALTVNENEEAVLQSAVAYESGNDIEVTIFNDQFGIEKKFTIHDFASKCKKNASDDVCLSELYVESTDRQHVTVSRNFFVKNNKWCVVLCLNETTDEKYIVMDEDGNLLGGLSGNDQGIFLSGMYKGTPYSLQNDDDPATHDEYFQLYKFTGQSGIQAVKVATLAKAYPNPLPAGQTFNIELAHPADHSTFVSVVDMKGRQILRRKISSGETNCQISGSRVGHGQYIYTVVYGNGETVSGKLIAE